jgi:hypothetical protein
LLRHERFTGSRLLLGGHHRNGLAALNELQKLSFADDLNRKPLGHVNEVRVVRAFGALGKASRHKPGK